MDRKRAAHIFHRTVDTIEDHPFEVFLSVALVFFGFKTLATNLQSAPGSVQSLPIALAVIYCALSFLGGLSVLAGLAARKFLGWAYGLERTGLFLSASAWGSYMFGLLLSPITGKSTLLIMALIALVLGCLFRARAINRRAQATLTALRMANEFREEG